MKVTPPQQPVEAVWSFALTREVVGSILMPHLVVWKSVHGDPTGPSHEPYTKCVTCLYDHPRGRKGVEVFPRRALLSTSVKYIKILYCSV